MKRFLRAALIGGVVLLSGVMLAAPGATSAFADRQPNPEMAMGAGAESRAVQTILAHAYRHGVRLDAPDMAVPVGQGDGESALTTLFSRYAKAIGFGQIAPSDVGLIWEIPRPAFDANAATAILADRGLDAALDTLPPPHRGYHRLVDALAQYRAIAAAGGWPFVPGGKLLSLGSEEERVAVLRRRLAAEGFLAAAQPNSTVYDARLQRAVVRFQRRHGLEPDGIVGTESLSALNVPVERRISQILANMERWRWLPRALPAHRAEVNIAASHLRVVENQKVALRMRVVVGSPRHPTPIFQSEIRSVVINPPWNVPDSIWKREIFPRLRKEPGYLASKKMSIVGRGDDPHGLQMDWAAMTTPPSGIRLQQAPGPWNALGRIKFNLPNRFDVYLHDTPERGVFKRASRALSHGCIRLEEPSALLSYLFPDEGQRPKVPPLQDTGPAATQPVTVAQPLPVFLLYWSAFAESRGTVHFRRDIYGHDAKIAAALAGKKGLQTASLAGGCRRPTQDT